VMQLQITDGIIGSDSCCTGSADREPLVPMLADETVQCSLNPPTPIPSVPNRLMFAYSNRHFVGFD
jgi:hypothetical protein